MGPLWKDRTRTAPFRIRRSWRRVSRRCSNNFAHLERAHLFRGAENAACSATWSTSPISATFIYPSVVRRGDLQIAVSTAGQSPSLAQKIRQQLEKQFGPGYAYWVAELGETRKLILASDLDKERKLDLLHSLASREAFEAALAELPELSRKRRGSMKGKVYLVGAGPGDPELLTVKASAPAAEQPTLCCTTTWLRPRF